MLRNIVFFLLPFFLSTSISAQFGSAPGGHSPWIKWKQINTDTFRIIFPEEMEIRAQRVSNMIHDMYENNRGSLGLRGEKINIVFRNQTLTPNGFVASNPYRSEFFATPAVANFAGTVDWMDLLTIHEYRHVIQSHNAKIGVTKLGYTLFGEGAWAGMSYLSIPNWFDEGDAVVQETALTNSGRGRTPKFFAGFKALSYQGKRYSYEKLRNGSLKNIVPNHYPLGYMMNTYARRKYGNDFWVDVYNDASKYKHWIFPFSRSLKKRIGLRTPQLYSVVLNEMDSIWQKKFPKNNARVSTTKKINKAAPKNTPTTYSFPQFIDNDNYITVKNSYKQTATVYQIDNNGKEKKLFPLGASFDKYISYKNGKIVWAELAFHPRWDYVNYSVIKLFDTKTKTIKKLSSKSKYLTPSISNDGKQIALVEVSSDESYTLKIISATNGALITTIPNPEKAFITYPQWSKNDQSIITIVRENQKNALVQFDLKSNQRKILIPFTANLIEEVHIREDLVFFTSSFEGTDNIYVIKLGDSTIRQVTNAFVKASYPSISPDGKLLLYTETTANGNDIHQLKLNPNHWKAIKVVEPIDQNHLINSIAKAEGGSIVENVSNKKYPIKKYSWFKSFIRPHSWAIIPDVLNGIYSWKLNSTNYLGTFNLETGPQYNLNEKSFSYITQATYSQLFPAFDIAHNSRFRRSGTFVDSDTLSSKIWNESAIVGIARLPLDFSTSNYNRLLTIGTRYSFNQLNFVKAADQDFNNNYNTLGAFLRFRNLQFRSRQEFNPRFGQSINMIFRQTLEKGAGQLFHTSGTFYFPGIKRTHSFYIQGAYQKQYALNDYKFPDFFVKARGFAGKTTINDEFYRLGANYSLAILYPDLAVGPFAYLKRIRLNVFADYSQSRLFERIKNIPNFTYTSVGVELSGDFGLLRIFELPMGVRFSYFVNKPDFVKENFKIEFILQ